MKYDIRNVTTYIYEAAVTSSKCAVRISPIEDGHQSVLTHELLVEPAPALMVERTGFAGDRLITLLIETPHRELKVEMQARVEVHRALPERVADAPSWEAVRDAAFSSTSLGPASPAHYLYPSRMVPILRDVTAYARESFKPGVKITEGAASLMTRIYKDFSYDSTATVVSTPLGEAFAARKGVCQDFAHIMVSAMRGLGLPAAYVSGYLRTEPPKGQPRLEGADATHAWAAVWCGADMGWVGFDPTNDVLVSENHIIIAMGRDYADVSPVKGVILGSGDQEIEVAVDVIPLIETPVAQKISTDDREKR